LVASFTPTAAKTKASQQPTNERLGFQARTTDMTHSNKLHPFALRAAVLSILITSCMALIPSLAATGGYQVTRAAQNLQAATATATAPATAQVSRATI
jgi:hypothetical protein